MDHSPNDFPRRATDKLRYADTDRQGHVNNAHFATFLETGRVEVLYDPNDPLTGEGAEFVVAKMTVEFRGEVHWPGSVVIGTGIKAIGTSSLTVSQAVFQDDQCVATGETVIVQIDTDTRSSRPLSDRARTRLSELRLDAE